MIKKIKNGANPRFEVNLKDIERLASLMLDDKEIATALGASATWFYHKKAEMPEIQVAIDAGKANGRRNLRSKQLSVAMGGSIPMLIFLGKQYLGQKDKIEHASDPDAPLVPNRKQLESMTDEELAASYNSLLKD